MKIITLSALLLTVLAGSILLFSGCEEQELGSRRRIRLVGDENIRLKKQFKQLNDKIQKLEAVITEYETEEQKRTDTEKETGDIILKLLRDSDAAGKEIEKLTDENLRLKTRIAELAESGDQPDSQ
jgi:peptidoglycan hydrolase CwlO-like protein